MKNGRIVRRAHERALNELGYRYDQWLRDLTRKALKRARGRKNQT